MNGLLVMTAILLLVAFGSSARTIEPPVPPDVIVRGDISCEPLWPYNAFPVARMSGIRPDPWPDGDPAPIRRSPHITSLSHCGQGSVILAPEGPSQVGRFALKSFSGGPPQLTPLFYKKTRVCDPEFAAIEGCMGGKIERGDWRVGSIGLIPHRDNGTFLGPPIVDPYQYFANLDGDRFWEADNIADMFEAKQYRYFTLAGVPPVEAWAPGYPGTIPYPPGAENEFAFNDIFTYEVPCYERQDPWRYVTLPTQNPTVPPGLRAIVGQASLEPKLAMLKWYSFNGCAGQFHDIIQYPWWPLYMCENFIHHHEGKTATSRYVWDADPERRGWWVEYVGFMRAWLVHQYMWSWSECLRGAPPDAGGCWTRWNCWHTGKVKAKINGDLGHTPFRDWVASHDSGFGLTFQPKTSHCNDCFAECLGMTDALGDIICPQPNVQEACGDAQYGNGPTPCLRDTGAHSMWYVPVAPLAVAPLPPSLHPVMLTPQYPETGLLHEIQRTLLDENGSPAGTQDGWANLIFSTTVPMLIEV